MKIENFLQYWSSELNVAKEEDDILIIDNFHKEADYDYGVWDRLSPEDIEEMKNNLTYLDLIPDIYYDGQEYFLFSDDLPCHFKLTKDQVSKVSEEVHKNGFEYLYDELVGILGEDNDLLKESYIKDICEVLKGNDTLDFSDIIEEKEDISLLDDDYIL